jgi:ABC-type metal ion transport system substrate-binding protein
VVLTDAANEARVIALLEEAGVAQVVKCHPGGDARVHAA